MARSSCLRHMAVPRSAMSIIRRASSASISCEGLVLYGPDRVVAHEVECSELLDGDRHTSLHVGFHGDVADNRDRGPARGLEQLDRLVGGRGIDVVDGDTRTGGRQGECDRRVRARARRR